MTTSKDDIKQLVDSFVGDLEALIRRAALAAVSEALEGTRPFGGRTAGNRKKAAPKAKAVIKKAPSKSSKGDRKRIRRSDEQIDELAASIHEYVVAHPGAGAEQIKGALKISKAEWLLPIKRLVDTGRVTAKGEKRNTTYLSKSSPRSSK